MLTTDQKEAILRRAGVSVPDQPAGAADASARELEASDVATENDGTRAPTSHQEATALWAQTIETLYVEYGARRAAKSLRDAEDARQLDALQRAGQQPRA
ncbi:MAG: hypothetical protein EOP82_29325 [Variovorax sp.]|nr:MAG: hypothetical protein EOP82_29325 [Variovorax sp.]